MILTVLPFLGSKKNTLVSFRDRSCHNDDTISALRAMDFEEDQAFLRFVSDEGPKIINNTTHVETHSCLGTFGKRQEGKHVLGCFPVANTARKM